MSDTNTASEQQPLIYHNGQPYSQERAAARRAELMSDAEYVKATLAGDKEKSTELANLWLLSRGQQPTAAPAGPQNVADVEAGMQTLAEKYELQAFANAYDRYGPESEAERADFMAGKIAPVIRDACLRNIERAKGDPKFRAALLSGEAGARRQWDRWHIAAYTFEEAED